MEHEEKKPPVKTMRAKNSKGDWGWWTCECGKTRPIEDYTQLPESKTNSYFLEKTCSVCGCSIDYEEKNKDEN